MLKLDWLKAFIVFSEQLNMTRAAQALCISQPALHVQLAKLSEALGVPLYRRKGRRLELTAEGERVALFAREEEERIHGLVEELQSGQDSQPVVLAAGEGSYLYLLGEAIRRFRKRWSGRLSLLTLDQEGALDMVRKGKAHLAVSVLGERPPDLEAHLLKEVQPLLALPRAHPLASRPRVTILDLEGERLVVPPVGRPHRATMARTLEDAGVAWQVAVEASGWPLILHFVQLGLGAAVVNGCCRMPRGVVAVPMAGLPSVRYYLAHRYGVEQREAVASLEAEILRAAKRASRS